MTIIIQIQITQAKKMIIVQRMFRNGYSAANTNGRLLVSDVQAASIVALGGPSEQGCVHLDRPCACQPSRTEVARVDEVAPQRRSERLGLVGHALAVELRDGVLDGREPASDVRVEAPDVALAHDDVAATAALPAAQAQPPAPVALAAALERVHEAAATPGAEPEVR
jgi:hypothetical protein